MSPENSPTAVTLSIEVDAPVEEAFRSFAEDFARFKPPEHNLLGVEITETVFEARVGGQIYDRGVDGSECRFARVLAFEPPHRLVFSWDISPSWQIESDPDKTSEVEVRFSAEGPARTKVELTHSKLHHHGEGWEGLRAAVDSEGGWVLYLRAYEGLFETRV
jgi:uncharacterized protein YndB with AHSA1/START domain